MCIIVYNQKNEKINLKTLKICWDNNPDGGGMMFVENGKLQIRKTMIYKEFVKLYKSIENMDEKSMVFHFRIGTSGVLDVRNAHPFYVNENLAFCHNGILDIHVPKDSKISDTKIFNNEFLKPLNEGFLKNKGVSNLITEFLNNKNKLCFMDNEENVTLFNEHLGLWYNGVWYSNSTYKQYKYVTKYDYAYDYQPCDVCGKYTEVPEHYDWETPLLCDKCKKQFEDILFCTYCGISIEDENYIKDGNDIFCKKCDDILNGKLAGV